jgi:acetylornithine deacetylase/succinyl-diaminopimelate desuccinylase-like protein
MSDFLSRDRIVELLQGLVRIPSANPTLVPDRPDGEAAVRRWLPPRVLAESARRFCSEPIRT